MLIKTVILNRDADLMILSEAEYNPVNEGDILGQFPNYQIHHKVIHESVRARFILLVEEDTINIIRFGQIKDPNMSLFIYTARNEGTCSEQLSSTNISVFHALFMGQMPEFSLFPRVSFDRLGGNIQAIPQPTSKQLE